MSSSQDLLKSILAVIFGSPRRKEPLKKRFLSVESLEVRELLTVVGFHSVQNASEGGQSGYFRLERDDTQGNLTVHFEIDDRNSACSYHQGWANNGEDFSATGLPPWNNEGSITFLDGQRYVDIAISGIDDDLIEGPEQISLTLLPGNDNGVGNDGGCGYGGCGYDGCGYNGCGCGNDEATYSVASGRSSATLTINDNDLPPTVRIDSVWNASEGGENGYVRLVRDSTFGSLTVRYLIDPASTAVQGADYSIAAGTNSNNYRTVSFSNGQEYLDIPIHAVDDTLIEGDENVCILLLPSLYPQTYAIDGVATATISILDNDVAPRVWIDSFQNATSDGVDGYVKLRRDDTRNELVVGFGIGDDSTAERNVEYSISGIGRYSMYGNVVFAAGEEFATIFIETGAPVADSEFVRIFLHDGSPTTYMLGDSLTASISLRDDIVHPNIGTGVDTYNATSGTALTTVGSVLDNDRNLQDGSIVDHSRGTVVLVDGPAHGTLQLNDKGFFTFVSDSDFVGADSFSYRIVWNDGTESGIGRAMINVTPDIGHVLIPPLGGPGIPAEPLAFEFLSGNNGESVFRPPVMTTGSVSETITTETPTSISTGDDTVLNGNLIQAVTTTVVMQVSTDGWSYSETVAMSYTESCGGTTSAGGYTYFFTAWANSSSEGFVFSCYSTDNEDVSVKEDGTTLAVAGFITNTVFLSSINALDGSGSTFEERYEYESNRTTDMVKDGVVLHAFESLQSFVTNSLTLKTLEDGTVKTTLAGSESANLEYSLEVKVELDVPSEMEIEYIVPESSSLILGEYSSRVASGYSGSETYHTTYEIVSVENPVTEDDETTYELLSIEGGYDTNFLSSRSYGDSVEVEYTLANDEESHFVTSEWNESGDMSTSAGWTAILSDDGEWLLDEGESTVSGSERTGLLTSVDSAVARVETETNNDETTTRSTFATINYVEEQLSEESYAITERVDEQEWVTESGAMGFRATRTENEESQVSGTVSIVSNDETSSWSLFDSSTEKVLTQVAVDAELNDDGEWETTGTRSDSVTGKAESYAISSQHVYQRVVDGFAVNGTYGYSERYQNDYQFNTGNTLVDGEWGQTTGSGRATPTSESGLGWTANCSISKNYGVSIGGDGVVDIQGLVTGDGTPDDVTEVVVTGTFSEMGFESDSSGGQHLQYVLVDGEWEVLDSKIIMTSTSLASMGYQLTSSGGDITVAETGQAVEQFHATVGIDAESGREKWGQATLGIEEYSSMKVDYPNEGNGSDTFVDSRYTYGVSLVLMPKDVEPETYVDGEIVGTGLFAPVLPPVDNDEEVELEWKAVFYDASLHLVQKTGRQRTETDEYILRQDGKTHETNIHVYGGMTGDFSSPTPGEPLNPDLGFRQKLTGKFHGFDEKAPAFNRRSTFQS